MPNYFYINGTTFDPLLTNLTARAVALAEWNATRTGPLVETNSVALGFLRLPDDSQALSMYGDPSSGPLSANTELLFAVSSCSHSFNLTCRMALLTNLEGWLLAHEYTCPSSQWFFYNSSDCRCIPHVSYVALPLFYDCFTLNPLVITIHWESQADR